MTNRKSISSQLGVAILGAGFSTRMGRPKLLLPWKDTSVIGHIIAQWKALDTANIAVVCRRDDSALRDELIRVGLPESALIFNDAPEAGMFSSVRCAAAWAGWATDLTHHVIALGDQPHLRGDTLKTLLDFASLNPENICQPSWNGRPRHPIIFPKTFWAGLISPTEPDLKLFLRDRTESVALCNSDDPGLDLDLDTPEDYRALASQ